MRKYLYILAALIVCSACAEKYLDSWEHLALDLKKFSLGASSTQMPVCIHYDGAWTAEITSGSEWLSVEPAAGTGTQTIHMVYEANTGLSRGAELTITTDKGEKKVVPVTQSGGVALPQIIVEKTSWHLPSDAADLEITIDTNIPSKYFQGIEPDVDYGADSTASWVHDFVMLDREEPLEREDMPDGKKRFATIKIDANDSGAQRQASVSVGLTDAEGTVYASAFTVIQTAEGSFIILPAKDLILKDGGSRKINITTNIEDRLPECRTDVTYPDGAAAFISNVAISGAQLTYDVAPNESGADRTAEIVLTIDDIVGRMTVQQLAIGADFASFEITDEATFDIWQNSWDKWKASDNVTLSADIDLTGKTWTPRPFFGTFNGKGHSIVGLNVSAADTAAFFSSMKGNAMLKDLTIGSESKPGSFTITAGGICLAGVVGTALDNVTISGVTSYASISGPAAVTNHYYGGIVGYSNGLGVKVSGCTNHGSISASGNATRAYVGGIVGYELPSAIQLTGCSNYGDITVSAALSNGYYGGIIGILASNSATANGATLTDCHNYGKVENKGAVTTLYFGGLIGTVSLQKADGAAITGCSNTGSIVNSGASKNLRMGGFIGDFGAGGSIKNCSVDCAVTNTADVTSGGNGRWCTFCASNTFATITIDDCDVKGTVTNTGSADTGYIAGVLDYTTMADKITNVKCRTTLVCSPAPGTFYKGMIYAGTGKSVSATNCGVAGSLLGTEITADNFSSYLAGVTMTATGCYFLTE